MAEKGNFDFLYNPIKLKMQELVSHINYTTYIEKLKPVDVDGRYIVLETPTESFAKYITGTLADKMREAIVKADVGLTDFRLKVEGSDGYAYNAPEEDESSYPSNLDQKFTFENFVVGKNNEFVHAAALSVADDPAGTYNPLFIYGGTGLGKTHLIQAIGNKIRKEKPDLRVVYVTCDKFFNDIIDSMLGHGIDSRSKGNRLRQYYRGADVLIIDDIQFIAKKKAVQEEFFHIFNELVSKGKQIVISSDQHPKELTELEERLRTRFSGGLLFDILPPNLETKIAILKQKAFEKKCFVPDEVLSFLAQDSGDDVRTREGAERVGCRTGQGRNHSRERNFRGYGLLPHFQKRFGGQEQEKGNSNSQTDLLLPYVRASLPPPYFDRKGFGRARPHHHFVFARQGRRNVPRERQAREGRRRH